MTETTKLDYIAFMCACHHVNYDYLEETLKEYPIGLYLMASEVTKESHTETNGEHFHFLVQMSDTDYHKYSKRVFKDKLKLRGQAKDGKPRQYGRVKKIEDLTRMAAYTIKQGNIRTNMTEAQLSGYKAVTFVAKEQLSYDEELYNYLYENAKQVIDTGNDKHIGMRLTKFNDIAIYVIKFVRNHKQHITFNRAKLDKYVRYYQTYYLKEELTDEQFLNQLI